MSLIFGAETVALGQAQSSQAPVTGKLCDVFFAVCYVARGQLSLIRSMFFELISHRRVSRRIAIALGILAGTGAGFAADPLGEFDAWLARYEAASVAERPNLTAEGERLAKRRQPAMLRLIATQPAMALRRAVPRLAKLPEPVAQYVEQHAEGLARYDVTVACGGARHRFCKVERRLMLDGRALTPRWHGRRAHLGSKENLPVHGIVLGLSLIHI